MDYIYENIKNICNQKGISISKLEKDCGLSSGSIIKWNDSSPKLDNIIKVATRLNVGLTNLLRRPMDSPAKLTILPSITAKEWDERSFIEESISNDLYEMSLPQLRELYSYVAYIKQKDA